MRNLKITRSMILAFVLGMSLSRLTLGAKVCIAVPLVLLWFMSYDIVVTEGKKNKHDYSIR